MPKSLLTNKVLLQTSVSLIIILSFAFILKVPTSAAILQKIHQRDFAIEEDYIQVAEKKTISITTNGFIIPAGSKEGFTIFSPVTEDPKAEDKLAKTIESIVIIVDGVKTDFELRKSEGKNQSLEVLINRNITSALPLNIELRYKSYGLLISTGAVKDVYIPGFPEDYNFESENSVEIIETTVRIPKGFPEINFISPTQNVIKTDDYQKIIIPQADLIGNSTWIQIGKEQYFEFEIKQKVPQTSNIPFALNTFSLPVPRNIQSGPITQQVFYTKLKPNPYSVVLDDVNNLIFNYKTSSSREMDIHIKGYAILTQNNKFNFENAGDLKDVPADFEKYLQAGEYWEVSSPEITAVANEIKENSRNLNESIQNTYNFVINRIDYSFVKKYGINERKGALATLKGGAAVCMEYSDLFIALLRAQGIPARAAFGYGFSAADFAARSDNNINHQWAEVYIPRLKTWINVDTTWGEFGNQLIGGDLNHFYSHVATINPDIPSTSELAFFGNLSNIPERNMSINILSNLKSVENSPSYSQKDLLERFTIPNTLKKAEHLVNSQLDIAKDIIKDMLVKLGIESPIAESIIFYSLFILPIFLILLLLFIKLRKHALKKISAPTHELAVV